MINAGAIATAAMVDGSDSPAKMERTIELMSRFAGAPLAFDESVYRSERDTGHRNRAIAYLLRNAGILDEDVDDVLDRYFRQCSMLVTCADLATMAATLANGGENPRTGERVIDNDYVAHMLSVMATCGMYDYAGSWLYRVGMPAKSGVAGGIIAVLPGQLGVGVFSPRLDACGNSVRGVAVCEALSKEFDLHMLRPPVSPGAAVITEYTLGEVFYHADAARFLRERLTEQEMRARRYRRLSRCRDRSVYRGNAQRASDRRSCSSACIRSPVAPRDRLPASHRRHRSGDRRADDPRAAPHSHGLRADARLGRAGDCRLRRRRRGRSAARALALASTTGAGQHRRRDGRRRAHRRTDAVAPDDHAVSTRHRARRDVRFDTFKNTGDYDTADGESVSEGFLRDASASASSARSATRSTPSRRSARSSGTFASRTSRRSTTWRASPGTKRVTPRSGIARCRPPATIRSSCAIV